MLDFNPTTMATQLATAYVQGPQDLLTSQKRAAEASSAALTRLRTALSTFNTALTNLSGRKGLVANTATFSGGASIGTASATSAAQPGNYGFFVEQLATHHQIAFEDLPAVPVSSGGPLVVQQADGSTFEVNLLMADQDGDGTLSQAEIARAINTAEGNGGKVTAMVMTVGGSSQLVLSAGQSGANAAITLDTSGLPASALRDRLSAAPNELSAARDAVVWLGDQGSGVRVQQAGNTFTAIAGVSITFERAMSVGESPVMLTVASDDTGTAANVRSFIDAYNALQGTLNDMTRAAEDAGARGAFASDASVRNLRNRLNELLRQDFGGVRLAELGIRSDRNGNLSLDAERLRSKLDTMPDALDKAFGSTQITNSTGVLGAMDRYLKSWLDVSSGQIRRRQDNLQVEQKAMTRRQDRIDEQFNLNYERYLMQFTQLQTLMGQMDQTSGLFSQLASSK